jgi:hypothetical protein
MAIAVVCIKGRKTHLFAIPLLSAPTPTCWINNAGAAAAAARILCHVKLLMGNVVAVLITYW